MTLENVEYLKENMESEVRDMCTLDEYVASKAKEEGKEEQMIEVLKKLMSGLTGGLNEAMNLLKFSDEEKIKYSELLKEK